MFTISLGFKYQNKNMLNICFTKKVDSYDYYELKLLKLLKKYF